jgi:3-oxoacyl-[acyl-carrier protein] reductase
VSAPLAVVTGASRGIGRRLVEDLAGRGFDVVCVARSSRAQPSRLPGTVEDAAAAVEARGRRAWACAMDVRDEQAVADLAGRVYAEWGRCDLLVNNAAVAPPRPACTTSARAWRRAA